MCVRVHRVATVTEPWDTWARVISVPETFDAQRATTLVRAVLAELGTEQPPAGAVCFCGSPVDTDGTPHIPQQTTAREVMARGA